MKHAHKALGGALWPARKLYQGFFLQSINREIGGLLYQYRHSHQMLSLCTEKCGCWHKRKMYICVREQEWLCLYWQALSICRAIQLMAGAEGLTSKCFRKGSLLNLHHGLLFLYHGLSGHLQLSVLLGYIFQF